MYHYRCMKEYAFWTLPVYWMKRAQTFNICCYKHATIYSKNNWHNNMTSFYLKEVDAPLPQQDMKAPFLKNDGVWCRRKFYHNRHLERTVLIMVRYTCSKLESGGSWWMTRICKHRTTTVSMIKRFNYLYNTYHCKHKVDRGFHETESIFGSRLLQWNSRTFLHLTAIVESNHVLYMGISARCKDARH